jgi:hypothetical protein
MNPTPDLSDYSTDTELHVSNFGSGHFYTDSVSLIRQIDLKDTQANALLRIAQHCFDKFTAFSLDQFVKKKKAFAKLLRDQTQTRKLLGDLLIKLHPTPEETKEIHTLRTLITNRDVKMGKMKLELQNGLNRITKTATVKRLITSVETNKPVITGDLNFFKDHLKAVDCLEKKLGADCECSKHFMAQAIAGFMKPSSTPVPPEKEFLVDRLDGGIQPLELLLSGNSFVRDFPDLIQAIDDDRMHMTSNEIINQNLMWDNESKEQADSIKELEQKRLSANYFLIESKVYSIMGWDDLVYTEDMLCPEKLEDDEEQELAALREARKRRMEANIKTDELSPGV